MAEPGGSANINGILFQILGTLGRAVDVTLAASVRNEDVVSALLTIEPRDGGDLQVEADFVRTVEQWKTRGSGRTWSLREVLKEVLPDLLRAVRDDDIGRSCRYRFMTDGRMGAWSEARMCFERMAKEPPPRDILAALDTTTPCKFFPRGRITERGFFIWITDAVRSHGTDDPMEVTHRKLWHLLPRFKVGPPVRADELISKLERFLETHVNFVEDVDGKRRELCGRVLELASQGEVRVTAEELLHQVDIAPLSFREWPRLRSRLRDLLDRHLSNEGYVHSHDVRPSPELSKSAPISVFYGESGRGKTWRMARLAAETATSERLVVWVPSARGDIRGDDHAAAQIWKDGLGHDQHLSLDRVAERRAKVKPDAPTPWALVCIDDVRTIDEARYLTNLDWGRWQLQLALTTAPAIADQIAYEQPARVQLMPVRDFSLPELADYLGRRGQSWAATPADVRGIIRRPILAKIYADLAEGGHWSPRHEYDLMEEYWKRISRIGVRHDVGVMRGLAETLLEPDACYPWPCELVHELNLPTDAVDRLERVGWLRTSEEGQVQVSHDRLLCWAVAEALVERLRVRRMSIEQMGEYLRSLLRPSTDLSRRLGYVALDVLWLMFHPDGPCKPPSDAWRLIAALESYGGLGAESDELYAELLPTLGEPAVSPVVERVRHAQGADPNPFPKLAASALIKIGQQESGLVREAACSCLADESPDLQRLAMRVLAKSPEASQLDRVWDLHKRIIRSRNDSKEQYYRDHKVSVAALRACLALAPEWVKPKFATPGDDLDVLAELVDAVATIGGEHAARIWRDYKARLFEIIPPANARSLVNCILSFRDREEVDRLERWASSNQEILGGWSLVVLALFDPRRAVKNLPRVPVEQLVGSTRQLGTAILALCPGEECAAMRELITTRPEHAHVYADLVTECGDRLDVETVDVLINWLDRLLAEYSAASGKEAKNPPQFALDLVESLWGTTVLERLQARAGSIFENRLAAAACRRADNSSGWVDHEFEAEKTILLKIGGEGFTHVVNAELAATSGYSKVDGSQWAPVRPDTKTRRLLDELAGSDELWTAGGKPFPLVQQKAADALAAIGESAALIRAIVRWGAKVSPYLIELRDDQAPMSDEEIMPALQLLDDPDHEHHANAILAIGHSGRTDFCGRIADLLLTSGPGSAVARASTLALEHLGHCDNSLLDRLVNQYCTGHHKYAVACLLSKWETKEAMDALEQALPAPDAYDHVDRAVAKYLCHDPARRQRVARNLREHLKDRPLFELEHHTFFETALEAHDPADQEILWEEISRRESSFHVVGAKVSAMRALARTQPDAAFELAEAALKRGRYDRELMPPILLQINRDQAIPMLCEHAAVDDDAIVRRAIGLALRHHTAQREIESPIRAMLQHPSAETRRAAALLAGYQEDGFLQAELRQMIYREGDAKICFEALRAVRHQQREGEARRLIDSIPSLDPPRLWASVEAIVRLADPDVLAPESDSLGFWRAIENAPYALRRHVAEALQKRRKDVEKRLKSGRH